MNFAILFQSRLEITQAVLI